MRQQAEQVVPDPRVTTSTVDDTDVEFFLFKDLMTHVDQIENHNLNQQVFTSDAEYMLSHEYLFCVMAQIENIKKMFQSANFNKHETKQLYERLTRVEQVLDQSIIERLALSINHSNKDEEHDHVDHSEQDQLEENDRSDDDGKEEKQDIVSCWLPRVVRMSQKLNLSAKEQRAFIYVLVSQCGALYSTLDSTSMISTAAFMAKYSHMSSTELLDFISPSRLHCKQEIIEVDSQYRDTLSGSLVKMPKECMWALLGSQLSAAEFLKIDKTAVAEILLEEPGFSISGITDDHDEANTKSKRNKQRTSNEYNNDEEFNGGEVNEEDLERELQELDDQLKEDEATNEFDLYDYLKEDHTTTTNIATSKSGEEDSGKTFSTDEQFLTPYKNDIEYLDDRFQFLSARIKVRNMESEKKEQESDVGYKVSRERSTDSILRELHAKERMLKSKGSKRLSNSKFLPRLERLAKIRNLDEFEKMILILLVSAIISHDVSISMSQSYNIRSPKDISVGYVLWILCDTLEERLMHRKYFYKKAALVKDGMIRVSDLLSGDLTECLVNIDRRMLDYIAGLDSEFSEIVEGSNLYFPQVKLENVVLPEEQKKLIIDTVSNFEVYKQHRKKLGFDDLLAYGTSLTLMFFGPSGTGKTMLANALANHLNKKLLLVNFSNLGAQAGELLKFIFREAKINDALLFFDECESFFESRKKGGSDVASLLTEIEKHDNLIIMATNRVYELDEAMHRRITLSVEFRSPDPLLRREIWRKHFPQGIVMADDIDFDKLSMNYELTGGLIKNAVLSALSFAVARDGKDPIIQECDLERAAKLQMQGILQMNEFDRRIVPSRSIKDLILQKSVMSRVQEIVSFEKARKILIGQWGFDERGSKQAMTILLHGPSGTGKSLCAEVIGFECGLPLKIVDMTEIMSKYAYNTTRNLDTLFRETKKTGAILVIELSINDPQKLEEHFALFSSLSQYNGMLIMITNVENLLNDPIRQKFKFIIEFTVPNATLRKGLWRKIIPSRVPLSSDINLDALANDFEFTGGQIENCVFRACARACLGVDKILTMKQLKDACLEEQLFAGASTGGSMYH